MQQAPDPIPVFRPTYLSDLHEFQGSLVEAPANIFYQKVNASRATLDRMQFQWRSVSDNLLLSPVAMLRFKLKITCPQMWSQVLAYVNVHNTTGAKGNHGNDITAAGVTTLAHAATAGGLSVPSICFADGDAFTSCCSSINFVFNGTSLSLNRTTNPNLIRRRRHHLQIRRRCVRQTRSARCTGRGANRRCCRRRRIRNRAGLRGQRTV